MAEILHYAVRQGAGVRPPEDIEAADRELAPTSGLRCGICGRSVYLDLAGLTTADGVPHSHPREEG